MDENEMMEQFFRKFSRMLGGGHKHEKVIKSIKPTEEEVMEMMALNGFMENAKKQMGIWQSKKALFWAKVELRTGEVVRPMSWNDEKNMIEVLGCSTEKEADNAWES